MLEPFTQEAKSAMAAAREEPQRLHHDELGTAHLLLGLVARGDGEVTRMLDGFGIDVPVLRTEVAAVVGKDSKNTPREMVFTVEVKRALEFAFEETRELAHEAVGPEHLLLGILREGTGAAAKILSTSGVDAQRIRLAISKPSGPNLN